MVNEENYIHQSIAKMTFNVLQERVWNSIFKMKVDLYMHSINSYNKILSREPTFLGTKFRIKFEGQLVREIYL